MPIRGITRSALFTHFFKQVLTAINRHHRLRLTYLALQVRDLIPQRRRPLEL